MYGYNDYEPSEGYLVGGAKRKRKTVRRKRAKPEDLLYYGVDEPLPKNRVRPSALQAVEHNQVRYYGTHQIPYDQYLSMVKEINDHRAAAALLKKQRAKKLTPKQFSETVLSELSDIKSKLGLESSSGTSSMMSSSLGTSSVMSKSSLASKLISDKKRIVNELMKDPNVRQQADQLIANGAKPKDVVDAIANQAENIVDEQIEDDPNIPEDVKDEVSGSGRRRMRRY